MQLIGGFKLFKGFLLIALASGGFTFLNKDLVSTLTRFMQHLNVDPGSKYFQTLMTTVVHFSPKLPFIIIGAISYGALFCVEGVGLLMHQRWAEYLTVIATGSFLPLEIYEIIKHPTLIKGIVIVVNLLILVYLVLGLKKDTTGAQGRMQTA